MTFGDYTVLGAEYMGYRLKRSPIPDALVFLSEQFLILWSILDERFNLTFYWYEFMQAVVTWFLFMAGVGMTAAIKFAKAYHEVIWVSP